MEEEDTIELIDLLRFLWKWKWFIISFSLTCAIAAGIISFLVPEVYKVSMVIEPGVIDIDPNGNFIYIDSPSNVQSKIDCEVYNRRVFHKLLADSKEVNPRFRTTLPKKTNTLEISVEANDTNTGVRALSALFNELKKEYSHYVEFRKLEFQQVIAVNERELDISAGEKQYLEKEIDTVKFNTNRIIEERNTLLRKEGSAPDKLSLLIYTNIIQQYMAYYSDLNKQLSEVKAEIEAKKSEIERSRIQKDSIENMRLIQEPQASIYPIKPKKKLNIALAFVIGLLISVFLAYFIEYIQKARFYPATPTTTTQEKRLVKHQQQ